METIEVLLHYAGYPDALDWDLGTKMFEAKLPDRGRSAAHAKCSHEKADYACEPC